MYQSKYHGNNNTFPVASNDKDFFLTQATCPWKFNDKATRAQNDRATTTLNTLLLSTSLGTCTSIFPNPPMTGLAMRYGLWNVCVCVHAKLLQVCPTLCDHMDCSLPGSSVHGILQAKILEWVAILFSRGFFPTQGVNPHLLCLLHWQAGPLSLVPWA